MAGGGDLAIWLAGLGYAVYLKRTNRAKFETAGRMINQELDQLEPVASGAGGAP